MNPSKLTLLVLLSFLGLTGCIQVKVLPPPTATFPSTAVPTRTPISPTRPITATPRPSSTRTPTARPTVTVTPSATPLPACAIQVLPSLGVRWMPQLQARIGCPTELPHNANFALQAFEHGTMYWREPDRNIIILFGDKTWAQYADAWTGGMPDDSCPGVTVPAGLVKPARGFGKVWCEQTGVRTKLGAAVDLEVGPYAAADQAFDRGMVFAGQEPTQLFVLSADGKWE